jgi:hypothetical protein
MKWRLNLWDLTLTPGKLSELNWIVRHLAGVKELEKCVGKDIWCQEEKSMSVPQLSQEWEGKRKQNGTVSCLLLTLKIQLSDLEKSTTSVYVWENQDQDWLTSLKSLNFLVSISSELPFPILFEQNVSKESQGNIKQSNAVLISKSHYRGMASFRMRLWNRHMKVKIMYCQNNPWKSSRKSHIGTNVPSFNKSHVVFPVMLQTYQLINFLAWGWDKKAQILNTGSYIEV